MNNNHAEKAKRKGGAAWAYDRFRSCILVQLMDDLSTNEQNGLPAVQTGKISEALQKLCNEASAIPDGRLFTPVYKTFEKFAAAFEAWKNIAGSDKIAMAARHRALQKMRVARHGIARKARSQALILGENLDLKLIRSLYSLFSDLAVEFPETLANLASALKDISGVLPLSKN